MYKLCHFGCLIIVLFLSSSCKWRPRTYLSGYTDTLYLYISSPSQGYLKTKYVTKGQFFKKEQLLYELDNMPDEANYRAALHQFRQAKNILNDLEMPRRAPEISAIEFQIKQINQNIDRTQKHYERLLNLKDQHFVDPDTLYTNQKLLEELRYQKKQFEENLKLAHLGARTEQIKAQNQAKKSALFHLQALKWYLQHKKIDAPGDGYVFDIFYSNGELIPANKPVMCLVLPENNYIEFFIAANELSKVSYGKTIEYQYYHNASWHLAKINFISQTAEYMPPILYTQQHQEELVFRIRATPLDKHRMILGQPIKIKI